MTLEQKIEVLLANGYSVDRLSEMSLEDIDTTYRLLTGQSLEGSRN